MDAQSPDEIAHLLAAHNDCPVRIYVTDEELSIPVEPYRSGTPEMVSVPVDSFTAVVENAHIEDGGLNFASFEGIHVPQSDWERLRLDKHWEADDVDLRSPIAGPHRRLEVWASKEHEYHEASEGEYSYEHLQEIPEDSPVLTEWAGYSSEDAPEKPPVPFERPTLSVHVLAAEGVTQTHGMDRVELGEIRAVEVLDDLDEWPEPPDIEPRELDVSPPSRHPEIEYSDIDSVTPTDRVLQAVFTINRYAKRLSEKADAAYQGGDGAEAKVHSVQKKALYKVKTVAVHKLAKAAPERVSVERHDIGFSAWCLYFDAGYSFHQPPEAVEQELLEDVTDDPDSISVTEIELESSGDTSECEYSLEQALQILAECGVNANEYLECSRVEDYNWGYVIGTEFGGIPAQ